MLQEFQSYEPAARLPGIDSEEWRFAGPFGKDRIGDKWPDCPDLYRLGPYRILYITRNYLAYLIHWQSSRRVLKTIYAAAHKDFRF